MTLGRTQAHTGTQPDRRQLKASRAKPKGKPSLSVRVSSLRSGAKREETTKEEEEKKKKQSVTVRERAREE